MILGYARVSTQEQSIDLQNDALQKAGCEEIYEEKVSGKSRQRPELEICLRALRAGDVLVVWKLRISVIPNSDSGVIRSPVSRSFS